MKAFISSLLSRKLWLAVAGLIVLAAESQWTEFVAVLLGYLGVNTVGHVLGDEGSSSVE